MNKALALLRNIYDDDHGFKITVTEQNGNIYSKYYFYYYGKKVMTYTMVTKSSFRYPTERYLNIVKQGYKDCGLDKKFLTRALNPKK